MGPMDSASRLAMVLRICVSGWSTKSATVDGGRLTADEAAIAAPPDATAASMSRLMMRPPGPEPATAPRSRPLSLARRRARGELLADPVPAGAATGVAE